MSLCVCVYVYNQGPFGKVNVHRIGLKTQWATIREQATCMCSLSRILHCLGSIRTMHQLARLFRCCKGPQRSFDKYRSCCLTVWMGSVQNKLNAAMATIEHPCTRLSAILWETEKNWTISKIKISKYSRFFLASNRSSPVTSKQIFQSVNKRFLLRS